MTFLSDMLARTEEAVAHRRSTRPLKDVLACLPTGGHDRLFLEAIQKPGMSIIAEFKRSSPTEGPLGRSPVKPPELTGVVQAYERGGASAVSVLTEPSRFGGSPDDLRVARAACSLPVLCKDFVIDEYQIYEAAEAGADAVLLMMAALTERGQLRRFHDVARELSLDVLVEVRNGEELERALKANMELIGINNRDLDMLTIDPGRTAELVPRMPGGVTVVSESGLQKVDDLKRLASQGVFAALIGTALMNAEDAEEQCRAFSRVATAGDEAWAAAPPSHSVFAA